MGEGSERPSDGPQEVLEHTGPLGPRNMGTDNKRSIGAVFYKLRREYDELSDPSVADLGWVNTHPLKEPDERKRIKNAPSFRKNTSRQMFRYSVLHRPGQSTDTCSLLKWEGSWLNQYCFYREQLLAGIFSSTLLSLWWHHQLQQLQRDCVCVCLPVCWWLICVHHLSPHYRCYGHGHHILYCCFWTRDLFWRVVRVELQRHSTVFTS